MNLSSETIGKVKKIVCHTLEIEPEKLGDDDNFVEDHTADSLRMIEVLAALEKELKITIGQTELAEMTDLNSVLKVVERNSA